MKNRKSPSYHDFALNDFALLRGGGEEERQNDEGQNDEE